MTVLVVLGVAVTSAIVVACILEKDLPGGDSDT